MKKACPQSMPMIVACHKVTGISINAQQEKIAKKIIRKDNKSEHAIDGTAENPNVKRSLKRTYP
jgi:hypothetical protein